VCGSTIPSGVSLPIQNQKAEEAHHTFVYIFKNQKTVIVSFRCPEPALTKQHFKLNCAQQLEYIASAPAVSA
jgi:hypothetical protein